MAIPLRVSLQENPKEGLLSRSYLAPDGQFEPQELLDTGVVFECEELLRKIQEGEGSPYDARELGSRLFELLLAPRWREHTARQQTAGGDRRLQVVVDISPTEAPRLWSLPWEAACLLKPNGLPDYVLSAREAGLLRRVHNPAAPTSLEPRTLPRGPLRVLVAISAPVDLAEPADPNVPEGLQPLDALKELRAIEGTAHCEVRHVPAEAGELRQGLSTFRPHVLHVIAHGVAVGGLASLVLEDPSRLATCVETGVLNELCAAVGHWPALLVLHACWCGSCPPIYHQPGMSLINDGLPVAVGFLYEADDPLASLFSRTFYPLVAGGERVDVAASVARNKMRVSWDEGVRSPGEGVADWMSPVVMSITAHESYLRIVEPPVATPTVVLPPIPAPPRAAPEPAPVAAYEHHEEELVELEDEGAERQPYTPIGEVAPYGGERRSTQGRRVAVAWLAAGLLIGLVGLALVALAPRRSAPPRQEGVTVASAPEGMVLVRGTPEYVVGCYDQEAFARAAKEAREITLDHLGPLTDELRDHWSGEVADPEGQLASTTEAAARPLPDMPARTVAIDDFYIDKYEVSNAQYARYLAGNPNAPAPRGWNGRECPEGEESLPVTDVTWEQARAYAESGGKRLPTAAEWQYAAAEGKRQLFPWGDEPIRDRANTLVYWAWLAEPQVLSVDQADEVNGLALHWMGGNVSELCADEEGKPVICGGCYRSQFIETVTFMRRACATEPPTQACDIGFRCAQDHKAAPTAEARPERPARSPTWVLAGLVLVAVALCLLIPAVLRSIAPS